MVAFCATKFTVPPGVSTPERILLSWVLKLYVFLHNWKLEIIIVAPSGTSRYGTKPYESGDRPQGSLQGFIRKIKKVWNYTYEFLPRLFLHCCSKLLSRYFGAVFFFFSSFLIYTNIKSWTYRNILCKIIDRQI